jgi:hypothetical protein
MIYYNIASIPERASFLQKTIDSILKMDLKADVINVYLNGYKKVPAWIKGDNIKVHRSQKTGDWGASGKFYSVQDAEGYYLTFDDDIVYPKDYAGYIVDMIERYKRKAVIGFHARVYNKFPLQSYHSDCKVLHFSEGLERNMFVHVLGTGTMGFHTDTIRPVFENKNLTDPEFSKMCIEKGIGQVSLCRAKGYIQEQSGSQGKALWKGLEKNDSGHLNIMNSIQKFRIVNV